MDSEMVFDNVKFEKAKAIARFNRFRKITNMWQFFEVFLVFAVVSWSSTRLPAVLKISGEIVLETSSYLLNHHVVFLIGNVIIILLFVLCRQSDAGNGTGTGDLYDDYVKHSEAGKRNSSVSEREPTAPPVTAEVTAGGIGVDDDEKKINVSPEGVENDDVAMAIENASKQLMKFQRTQSEKLKREIAVKPRRKLQRSGTENHREDQRNTAVTTVDCVPAKIDTLSNEEFQRLSNEEFQRTVDAFIQKHWNKKLRY